MKRVRVVIGAAFGDEGKGLVTDYLSKDWADMVVRFNGGAQAAHTVKKDNGVEHVFGHFGSGTLNNIPTYLSSYFVVNPDLFLKELAVLENKGVTPVVYVNENCYVTTFIDVLINQLVEDYRGNGKKHGSCGVGFNETITRCLHDQFNITVGDILHDMDAAIDTLIDVIEVYAVHRLSELAVPLDYETEYSKKIDPDSAVHKTIDIFKEFLSHVIVVGQSDEFLLATVDNIVFEGAQGLLLDEMHEWFPHVTRSRTGTTNVAALLKTHTLDSVDIYYITRAYTTRHGAGPFPKECDLPEYSIIDITNVANPFQGTLRYGYLDVSLISQSICDDIENYNDAITDAIIQNTNITLVITCIDQVEPNVYYYDMEGRCRKDSVHMFVSYVSEALQMPILLNASAITPKRMKWYSNTSCDNMVCVPIIPAIEDTATDAYFDSVPVRTKKIYTNNRITHA